MNRKDILEIIFGVALGLLIFGSLNDDKSMSSKKDVDSNKVAARYFLSGGTTKVNANNFEGGNATAFMGGGRIDLTEANLAKENHLRLNATMGGIDVVVPKDWFVQISGNGFMGSVQGPKNDSADAAKTLYVTGSAFMGGVNVRRSKK